MMDPFWNDPHLAFLAPANRLCRRQVCAEMAPNCSNLRQENLPHKICAKNNYLRRPMPEQVGDCDLEHSVGAPEVRYGDNDSNCWPKP